MAETDEKKENKPKAKTRKKCAVVLKSDRPIGNSVLPAGTKIGEIQAFEGADENYVIDAARTGIASVVEI